MTIQELKAIADNFMGEPNDIKKKDRIIGYSEYRDGSILDAIYEV